MTTPTAPAFIGIEEKNDAEGETFGYYVSDTPANRHALERLDTVFRRTSGKSGSSFTIALWPRAKTEIEALERGAGNNYMPRVQFIAEPVNWARILCAVENNPDALYKSGVLPLKSARRTTLAR